MYNALIIFDYLTDWFLHSLSSSGQVSVGAVSLTDILPCCGVRQPDCAFAWLLRGVHSLWTYVSTF